VVEWRLGVRRTSARSWPERRAARRAWRGGFVLVELEQAGAMGSSVACCMRASWWRSNRGAVRRER
jgi:hypothetical protein